MKTESIRSTKLSAHQCEGLVCHMCNKGTCSVNRKSGGGQVGTGTQVTTQQD